MKHEKQPKHAGRGGRGGGGGQGGRDWKGREGEGKEILMKVSQEYTVKVGRNTRLPI